MSSRSLSPTSIFVRRKWHSVSRRHTQLIVPELCSIAVRLLRSVRRFKWLSRVTPGEFLIGHLLRVGVPGEDVTRLLRNRLRRWESFRQTYRSLWKKHCPQNINYIVPESYWMDEKLTTSRLTAKFWWIRQTNLLVRRIEQVRCVSRGRSVNRNTEQQPERLSNLAVVPLDNWTFASYLGISFLEQIINFLLCFFCRIYFHYCRWFFERASRTISPSISANLSLGFLFPQLHQSTSRPRLSFLSC